MDFDGYAVAHGVGDLLEFELDRLVNFVWYMISRDRESKDLLRLRALLWQPPAGDTAPIPAQSPWAPEQETGALSAMKAELEGRTLPTRP